MFEQAIYHALSLRPGQSKWQNQARLAHFEMKARRFRRLDTIP